MMTKQYKDKYKAHLKEVQKKNPKVIVVFDTTEEETDWLKQKERNKKRSS